MIERWKVRIDREQHMYIYVCDICVAGVTIMPEAVLIYSFSHGMESWCGLWSLIGDSNDRKC